MGRKRGWEESLERRHFRIFQVALLLYTKVKQAKCVKFAGGMSFDTKG